MKARVMFEPGDFKGCGQMIVRNHTPSGLIDLGFVTTVAYKIGFIAGSDKLCKISLADGMVLIYTDEAALIDHLNSDPRGYRPMTNIECVAVAAEVGNRRCKS